MVGHTGMRLRLNADGCDAFGSLVHLRRVALPSLGSPTAGWPRLAKGLTGVEEAWIRHFGDAFLAVAEHMTALVRLRFDLGIYDSCITDTDRFYNSNIRGLKPFSRIRHIFLRGNSHDNNQGYYLKLVSHSSGHLTDAVLR
mgnify:CR=1 FL=1